MALGGGLAATMPSPVDARGHQLDGRRVDHVDDALEPTRQPAPLSSVSKARLQVLQMREHAPE